MEFAIQENADAMLDGQGLDAINSHVMLVVMNMDNVGMAHVSVRKVGMDGTVLYVSNCETSYR